MFIGSTVFIPATANMPRWVLVSTYAFTEGGSTYYLVTSDACMAVQTAFMSSYLMHSCGKAANTVTVAVRQGQRSLVHMVCGNGLERSSFLLTGNDTIYPTARSIIGERRARKSSARGRYASPHLCSFLQVFINLYLCIPTQ